MVEFYIKPGMYIPAGDLPVNVVEAMCVNCAIKYNPNLMICKDCIYRRREWCRRHKPIY
jgi:hypothetical protein